MDSGKKRKKSKRRLLLSFAVIIVAAPAIFLTLKLGVIRMPGVAIPNNTRSILQYGIPKNRSEDPEKKNDIPAGEALPTNEDMFEYEPPDNINTAGNAGRDESKVKSFPGGSSGAGRSSGSGNAKETEKTGEPEEPEKTEKTEKDVRSFMAFIEEHVSTLNGQYGIYYINLADGLEFGVNEREEFHAASTVKIPLALCISLLMEEGIIQPDRELIYTEDDFETGSGRLQFEEYGTRYTVQELIDMSIRLSDNVAANMLLRMLGRRNLKTFMRSMGGRVVDDDRNVTCPRDMAIYMKKVYDYSQKSGFCRTLLHHLENTVFNDRLPALLPKDIKVAHKIGTWYGSYHDVGIVFTEKPYIISIMSKDVNESDALRDIADISRMFFDFFS